MAHGVSDSQLSSYIMKKMNTSSVRQGRELVANLVIVRQPNLQTVDSRGEFVDYSDQSAVGEKPDDPDAAVYILNDKLQVTFLSSYSPLFITTTWISTDATGREWCLQRKAF